MPATAPALSPPPTTAAGALALPSPSPTCPLGVSAEGVAVLLREVAMATTARTRSTASRRTASVGSPSPCTETTPSPATEPVVLSSAPIDATSAPVTSRTNVDKRLSYTSDLLLTLSSSADMRSDSASKASDAADCIAEFSRGRGRHVACVNRKRSLVVGINVNCSAHVSALSARN